MSRAIVHSCVCILIQTKNSNRYKSPITAEDENGNMAIRTMLLAEKIGK